MIPFGLLLAVAMPVSVSAQVDGEPRLSAEPAEPQTARGLALGTGARASAVSTSALAYNPAALPLGQLYHLEAQGDYHPATDQFSVKGAVADSMTSMLGAGLSLRGFIENGPESYSGIDARLGLGIPLSDVISLGASGRYVSLERSFRDAAGQDREQELATGFTMDASVRLMPIESVHISALAYNIINIDDSPLVPTLLGGSAAVNIGSSLTLGADALVDVTTFDTAAVIVGGGAEYLAGGNVPLRLGYRFDEGRDEHALSGGLGYVDDIVGADLSLRQQFLGGSDTTIMLSLRYFVQ